MRFGRYDPLTGVHSTELTVIRFLLCSRHWTRYTMKIPEQNKNSATASAFKELPVTLLGGVDKVEDDGAKKRLDNRVL